MSESKFKQKYETCTSLEEHVNVTYEEMLYKLKKKNFALVVRPTGYGKSKLITRCIRENPIARHLIVVPTIQLFNYFTNNIIPNYTPQDAQVTVVIYTQLSGMYKRGVLTFNEYDFIYADEIHRGSANTYGPALSQLVDRNSTAKLIGLTATPWRGDLRTHHLSFFVGGEVTPFHYVDIMLQGFLPPIRYVGAMYRIKAETDEIKRKLLQGKIKNKNLVDEGFEDQVRKRIFAILENNKLEKIVAEFLPSHEDFARERMTFIVFCPDTIATGDLRPEVEEWFKYALKERGKAHIPVKSYDLHYKVSPEDRVRNFDAFITPEEQSVKLLFTVNSLSEGVHFDHLTGVVMLRGTASEILYTQQMGRAIHEKDESPLVFDFVTNYASVGTEYFTMIHSARRKTQTLERKKYIDAAANMILSSKMFDNAIVLQQLQQEVAEKYGFRYVLSRAEIKRAIHNVFDYVMDHGVDYTLACRALNLDIAHMLILLSKNAMHDEYHALITMLKADGIQLQEFI